MLTLSPPCELRSAWLTDALTHAITRENTRVKTDVHESYIRIWPDYVARVHCRVCFSVEPTPALPVGLSSDIPTIGSF